MTPSELDDLFAPVLLACNRARQIRDALPEGLWLLVPSQIRVPIDSIFAAVEKYERAVGIAKEAGLMD